MDMTLDAILEEIKKAEKIVILTHESPDGDAVASSLSVMHAMLQLGKEPDVIIPEYAKDFKFLPGSDKIKVESAIKQYDLAISVDCSDLKRLVGSKEYFETAKKTIQIDHHSVNAMFADLNYVDPVAPACCQVLIGMFEYLGVEIDKEIGTCILTGIIADTGGFQYSGVTSETFEFAAELLKKGVNISKICQKVLRNKTKAHCELVKLLYNRMEFFEDGKIVISYITVDDYKKVNAEMGDDEGLAEMERDIEGVEVAVLLKEKEGVNGFKASLRSKEYVNVSDVCMLLGGGGHPKAAGCLVGGTLEQVKTKVVNTIKQQI
ncbi:MAG: bifunctional oligoribonuclease/PAP phosphatase NrnA [Clostridia bacterium]|nr:bifunctional oligoribonuclease/PAP phosphatase NrnA [Clostridia bacterium]